MAKRKLTPDGIATLLFFYTARQRAFHHFFREEMNDTSGERRKIRFHWMAFDLLIVLYHVHERQIFERKDIYKYFENYPVRNRSRYKVQIGWRINELIRNGLLHEEHLWTNKTRITITPLGRALCQYFCDLVYEWFEESNLYLIFRSHKTEKLARMGKWDPENDESRAMKTVKKKLKDSSDLD